MPVQLDPEGNEIKYLRQFAHLSDANVLEIGCGDGRLTRQYVADPNRITAFDPDLNRLLKVQRENPSGLQPKVAFIQAFAQAIPLSDETFNRAILAWSL